MKKKYVRWTLWTIASPFILFIILCILIYLPPIQNFLVDKAAVYASEATGMNISVGRISLSFPLNLVVTDVDAASPLMTRFQFISFSLSTLPFLQKHERAINVFHCSTVLSEVQRCLAAFCG
jgi:hypothetical protein